MAAAAAAAHLEAAGVGRGVDVDGRASMGQQALCQLDGCPGSKRDRQASEQRAPVQVIEVWGLHGCCCGHGCALQGWPSDAGTAANCGRAAAAGWQNRLVGLPLRTVLVQPWIHAVPWGFLARRCAAKQQQQGQVQLQGHKADSAVPQERHLMPCTVKHTQRERRNVRSSEGRTQKNPSGRDTRRTRRRRCHHIRARHDFYKVGQEKD